MSWLLEKIEAAINETERIATEALDKDERVTLETHDVYLEWEAYKTSERDLDDPWVGYRDELGTVAIGMRAEQAIHIAHNDPKRVLRRVARDRKLLKLAAILREDYQDNAADHLVRLLAEDYEIQVES